MNTNQISAKVDDLANQTGTIVKVRTIPSYAQEGATNVTSYTDHMLKQCSSWTGGDGKFQSNYVLLLVSIGDRKSDYWVGDALRKKLDMVSIEKGMGSQFHQGNFQQGMINGLNSIGESLSFGWWLGNHWLLVLLVIAAIVFIIWLPVSPSRRSPSGGYSSSSSSSAVWVETRHSDNSGGDSSSSGGFGESGSSIGGGGGSTGF
jgi:uncharacterized membrane protein YgcG